jgi:hypothetical protein
MCYTEAMERSPLGTVSEVLMAMTLNSTAFFIVTPCSSETAQCFKGTHCLRLLG